MSMSRLRNSITLTAIVGAAAALVMAKAANADSFPSGPVELVVPWDTGGGTDRSARLFAPYLSEALGVPVNVVNIAGGSGWTAWSQMARWDPEEDDHKIGLVNIPHVFAYLDPDMGRTETWEDFNLVSGQTFDPCTIVVRDDDERFQTLNDFIEYVQEHQEDVVISSTAIGSDNYQAIAYAMNEIEDFNPSMIYANNDAEKVQALLEGSADAISANTSYYVPYIRDGEMRALATLMDDRSRVLPSVPTFQEQTGIDNICFAGRMLAVAPGLDEEKYEVYREAISAAQQNPAYAMAELDSYSTIWDASGEELLEFIRETEERVLQVRYWEREE